MLSGGLILGWVNGKYEIGPRALGNRSILAAPFDDEHESAAERDQAARAVPTHRAGLPEQRSIAVGSVAIGKARTCCLPTARTLTLWRP